MRAVLLFLALWAGLAAPLAAQDARDVLIVDRERILSESAPAQVLRREEQLRRQALRARFEETRKALEAEEAEIAELRGSLTASEFEERVRAFDQSVREARRESQGASEALQSEFTAARRKLSEALAPVLTEILTERGASIIVDARTALIFRDEINVTDEALARFSELEIDFQLSPAEGGGDN